MLFNSYSFLIFFPIVTLVYFIIPKRFQYIWLLITSYFFYMGWNAKYALLLLILTMITYASGLVLAAMKPETKRNITARKCTVAASFLSNLAILFFFKYFDFAVENINAVLSAIHVEVLNPQFDVLLPVGISFYTFQALSYTMDVYRGEIVAEKNPLKYALFVSFFPQLVAGPIERSKNLLKQVNKEHSFSYERMCDGLMTMLWGYFLKLVIADRIAIFVDAAYGTEVLYDGKYLLLASALFAIQIYCDFAGYSTIAVGAARIMGFELMENFNCPYYAQTVAEFWRRWHISLSTWFRDYLYIPLGGNRKGTVRKYINTMIVFLVSGLWHGANWTYVIWGGLNGIYQVIEGILTPVKKWFYKRVPALEKGKFMTVPRILVTFLLVDFAWIFFRADSLEHAVDVIYRMFHINQPELLANGTLFDLGLNQQNLIVLAIAIIILLLADVAKYHHIKVREVILNRNIVLRWFMILAAVLAVLVFGIWGSGYEETNFIYFQF